MSDYTPTTDRVRADYIHGVGGTTWYEGKAAAIGEVFDRWLAEVIRNAKHEAWHDGFTAGWQECDDPEAFVNSVWDAKTPNPYRKGEQEWIDGETE